VCSRCVMDTTDTDISFDDKGQCNHCTTHIEILNTQTHRENSELPPINDVINRIKQSGGKNKYDCIIGISGGVDSCYAAYIAHQLGLRPLLVHMDNGWDSENSVSNIQRIVDKLELEYYAYVLDWQEFRELQLAFLKSSIVDLEIPTDIAIPAALHEIASKYNVKYILSGSNFTSEGILPLKWGYHVMKDMKLYNHIVKKYSKVPRKKVPTFGVLKEAYYKFVKGIKIIYILDYIDYNKDEAKDFLEKKFDCNFPTGKHHESLYTKFWQSYILPVKHNIDYRKATYSTQICSGQITREVALKKIESLPYNPDKIESEKEYVCKKLGISVAEFEKLMKQPPKNYTDFPNSEKWIKRAHNLYKFLFPRKRI
jgi:N-acetyl sugar amidotransferase